MTSRVIIPFNNCPAAVSVKTASYTIPAGKYALLTVNLIGTATFTIGGVTALQGAQNNTITNSNGLFRGTGTPSLGFGDAYTIGGLVMNAAPSTNSYAQNTAYNPPTPNQPVQVFANETDQKVIISEVWVTTGTVISGTGTFRIIVQEYNVIS
jgi:hypothetical protein